MHFYDYVQKLNYKPSKISIIFAQITTENTTNLS